MLMLFCSSLFCQAERVFNQQLTDRLEASGFRVFLPQRDGAERDKAPYDTMTEEEHRQAIFHLDKTRLLASDIFPVRPRWTCADEGACR